MRRLIRENGLTLALLLLFLFSILGHSFAGLADFNEEQSEHGRPELTYMEYLSSDAFKESVFENWESEFLQMSLYVLMTAFLFQRGSAESKDPDRREDVDEDPGGHHFNSDAPFPVRAGGFLLRLYQNSLFLALWLIFVACFALHLFSSRGEACREQMLHGRPCATALEHLRSATFWFESFQNWQSEFLSIAALVVLSIFLRQKGSPESKPVHAPHRATGR